MRNRFEWLMISWGAIMLIVLLHLSFKIEDLKHTCSPPVDVHVTCEPKTKQYKQWFRQQSKFIPYGSGPHIEAENRIINQNDVDESLRRRGLK